jgi:hypothetical protein
VIHPMQYELERAYHLSREAAVAGQRRAAGVERSATPHTLSMSIHLVRARLTLDGLHGIRPPVLSAALPRGEARHGSNGA